MSIPVTYTRHRIRDRVRSVLASDSVRNFIWIFYIGFLAWGLWGTFWAYPIDLIVKPMGQLVYNAWVWMPLLAMPTALGGLVLRHGGSPADEINGNLLRRDFLGLWMQVGGHVCMVVTLSVYIAAAIYGSEHRQPLISVFVFVPYLLSVVILAAQCVYKIRLGKPVS
jgi:hypothetical protein